MGISGQIFRQYDIRGIVGQDLTTRVAHGVTPVTPLDPLLPAYRDVLVVTFKRRVYEQALRHLAPLAEGSCNICLHEQRWDAVLAGAG